MTWFVIATVVALVIAVMASESISSVGKRRYPNMTLDHNHHRTRWNSLGLVVAIVLVFPVALVLLTAIASPVLCGAFGATY